ncbi:MAG: ATPase [Deltaproteobacteria bacterium]|nr:ATPase [Deltaproteobacteria bacterium]
MTAGRAPYFVGVDSGSWNTKAALIDAEAAVLATTVSRTGADLMGAATKAVAAVLGAAGLARPEVAALWATGFGRHALTFADHSRTELDAHARGVLHFAAGPLTVIDIGGQDAKIIQIDHEGRRLGHKMNRKCAAGTGSFLEEMALRLDLEIGALAANAAQFQEEIELGSFCTVFTGTEVLGLIRQGKRPADLARASYRSVVKRVLEMDRVAGKVVATGGVVAHHPMVVELLGAALQTEVVVPPYAQEMGALGVALSARAASLAASAAALP